MLGIQTRSISSTTGSCSTSRGLLDYIGMSQYYKFAIAISDFDKLFEKPIAEIERAVSKLSDGQKKSIAYRAKQLIASGGIDSNKTIATLEKCLGVELVEHDK